MRILHYATGTIIGGIATLVYDLCKEQVKRYGGGKVDYFAACNDDALFEPTGRFEKLGVRVIRSRYNRRWSPGKVRELMKLFREYDLVHVHLFPNLYFAAVAWTLLPKNQRPVLVMTEHNTWNNRRNYPIFRWIDRVFYAPYAALFCISHQTEMNLNSWLHSNKLAKKMKTIVNGIDIEKFRNAKNRLAEVIPVDPEARYVVMVARMGSPKDPLTMIRAIARCRDNIHGVFIGSGDFIDDMISLSRELGIAHRIHCLGVRQDVPNLLKGCHIGVLSTRWDGFGLVAAEYMAAGMPVLASDVDGLRDVVGNSDYLFPVGDIEILAGKISLLTSDQEALEKACEYFGRRVPLFSAERMADEYCKEYDRLLVAKNTILI